MKHGSLFSGIGGFDLASEWMGWDNVFHCEIEPFPKKILQHYWPNADSLGDIKKTDFKKYEGRIDIISGGFPCQPYSAAGKRKGKEDDRHLWPEMLRAIREIKPRWIVGENVYGLTNWNGGLVFEEIHTDLEAEGYEVWAVILPAVSKDAPHRRDRVWFIANSNISSKGSPRTSRGVESDRCKINDEQSKWGNEAKFNSGCNEFLRNATNSKSERSRKQSSEDKRWQSGRPDNNGEITNATNSNDTGLQRRKNNRNTTGIRQKSNEQFAGCVQSTWEIFPTQSPVCGGDDGLPTELDGITFPKWRNESIKGYGNAVVPQVVYEIFKTIECIESIT